MDYEVRYELDRIQSITFINIKDEFCLEVCIEIIKKAFEGQKEYKALIEKYRQIEMQSIKSQ